MQLTLKTVCQCLLGVLSFVVTASCHEVNFQDQQARDGLLTDNAEATPELNSFNAQDSKPVAAEETELEPVESIPPAEGGRADPGIAVEPVAIGGAFLVCQIQNEVSSAEQLGVSCNFDASKLTENRMNALGFSFSSGDVRTSATKKEPSSRELRYEAATGIWAWNFLFSRAQLNQAWLFVEVADTLNPKDPVKQFDLSLIGTKTVSLTTNPVHVGDNNFMSTDYASLCVYDISKTQDVGLAKTWSFEVKGSAAELNINLNGICGIDPRLNKLTRLLVLDPDKLIVASIAFDAAVSNPRLQNLTLKPGLYTIGLELAKMARNDFDDFLIGGISLEPIKGLVILNNP